jgi:hypothetical protein
MPRWVALLVVLQILFDGCHAHACVGMLQCFPADSHAHDKRGHGTLTCHLVFDGPLACLAVIGHARLTEPFGSRKNRPVFYSQRNTSRCNAPGKARNFRRRNLFRAVCREPCDAHNRVNYASIFVGSSESNKTPSRALVTAKSTSSRGSPLGSKSGSNDVSSDN